jgi:F-type H+-transporting ATPase subunit gamma
MASLQDIRRRIRSVKNTQQVTKAMKMISAVKLRKSQERLLSMRPFVSKLYEAVGHVVARFESVETVADDSFAGAFLFPREEKNAHLVVIASDKGLCGGFNANLLKAAEAFMKDHAYKFVDFAKESSHTGVVQRKSLPRRGGRGSDLLSSVSSEMADTKIKEYSKAKHRSHDALKQDRSSRVVKCDVIGRRAAEWAKKAGIKPSFEAVSLNPDDYYKVACEIADNAIEGYINGEIDALYLIYNYFNSAISQTPKAIRIFPPHELPEASNSGSVEHLLEPDPETVLENLLPHFVETEIYRTLLESAASEHAARMSAMDKATSNAGEMIDSLTLHMNKVRQAAITNQIIEVVSGAAS